MNKWLILDCHYLCHRAFHTTGELSFDGVLTGVIFGFLRDIVILQDLHETSNIIFCFDSKTSERRKLYPPYKEARRKKYEIMEPEEAALWQEMRNQIKLLRIKYLPALGFNNVLLQRGYEADDLIASLVLNTLPDTGDEAIIVASDADLYQLLGPLTSMWNPVRQKMTTRASFKEEYLIDSFRWAEVKAFAGCSSDGIEGIAGIGEKTAVKWITGNLKKKSKAHDKILQGMDIFTRNLPLVKLPFEGTKTFTLQKDEVTEEKWKSITNELGMRSLSSQAPTGRRSKSKRAKKARKGFGLNDGKNTSN